MRIMIAEDPSEVNKFMYYITALKETGAEDIFLSLDADDVAGADGLVIPGGKNDIDPEIWGAVNTGSRWVKRELDDAQWRIMEQAEMLKVPVLGICRGCQFINVYFGGSLIQDLECGEAHIAKEPDQYHMLKTVSGTFMEKIYGSEFIANSRHHQAVEKLGNGLLAGAFWEEKIVEMIFHQSLPVLGVQWHPERMMILGNEMQKESGRRIIEYFTSMTEKNKKE